MRKPVESENIGWVGRVFLILGILLFWGLAFIAAQENRAVLARAEHLTGVVMSLHSRNGRCDEQPQCTQFSAALQVRSSLGESDHVAINAGFAGGFDRPTSLAKYRVGDSVPITVDPLQPDRAQRDSVMGQWASTAVMLGCSVPFLMLLWQSFRNGSERGKGGRPEDGASGE